MILAASAKSRAAGTRTAASSGTGASSRMRTKRSSTTLPFLMSGIDPLFERLDADALDGVDEQFAGSFSQLDISGDHVFDNVGDFRIGHCRTEQRAELRLLIGAAAKRYLKELLAVLLHAQNADVTDMVMTAGIDAAGNVD